MSKKEFNLLIKEAIDSAIDIKLKGVPGTHLLTTQQAAEYLQCSTVFLWKLRKDGKLHATGSGKKIYYRKEALDAFLEGNKKEVCHG